MDLEDLKAKIIYHHNCLRECLDNIYEINELEGDKIVHFLEENDGTG